MNTATVTSVQRFTRRRPCPVCGGGSDLPAGQGVRCYGFLGADERYAHCTREEFAGGLPQEGSGSYAHRLDAPCKCGAVHADAWPDAAAQSRPTGAFGETISHAKTRTAPRREIRREAHGIAGTDQVVQAIHRRVYFDDGAKKMWWERPDGASGLGGLSAADLPPYGAHEWHPDRPTIHVEGEPARDALAPLAEPLGYNVIGHVTGAPATHSPDSLRAMLSPKHYLWPDSDPVGKAQMARTDAALRSLLSDERGVPLTATKDVVLRVAWAGARPGAGDDAADFVARGGTTDELQALLAQARPWSEHGEAQDGAEPEAAPPAPRLVIRSLADVIPQPIAWLWPRWLARGKLHIFAGHPGHGKSTLAAWLAAMGSTGGHWPDGQPAPRFRTLFVLGEDSLEDTLRPRLDLFGAAVGEIEAIEAVLDEQGRERFFDVAKHLELLEEAVVADGIDLLLIDPISTAMAGSDRNAEGDTRDRLTPLVKLAERRNLAVLGIGHVGKPTGTTRTPLQRILGSTGLGALARLVWMTATADERMAVGPVKSNLAIVPEAMFWTRPEDGPIEWHGTAGKKLERLLDEAVPKMPRVDAEAFLREFLAPGSRLSVDVEAEAEARGITKATLRRASEAIPVKKWKASGHNGQWYWSLPDGQPTTAEGPETPAEWNLLTPIHTEVSKLSKFQDGKVLNVNGGEHLHATTPIFANGQANGSECVMGGAQLAHPTVLNAWWELGDLLTSRATRRRPGRADRAGG
jgi:putative DNA primase/helicase